jgi:hypothetical protein
VDVLNTAMPLMVVIGLTVQVVNGSYTLIVPQPKLSTVIEQPRLSIVQVSLLPCLLNYTTSLRIPWYYRL